MKSWPIIFQNSSHFVFNLAQPLPETRDDALENTRADRRSFKLLRARILITGKSFFQSVGGIVLHIEKE